MKWNGIWDKDSLFTDWPYNCDVHESIWIIIGTNVTEKVGNQKLVYFPMSPNYCFCTTWGNRKPGNCIFFTWMMHAFYQKHTKHIWKISPFTVKTIDCVHQTGPRKGAWHPAICYPHSWCLPSLSQCWSLCQKWTKLFITSSVGAKATVLERQYCFDVYILLSHQMLDAIIAPFITILSFSNTVHRCISHSTQSNCMLQCKTQLPFS